MPITIMEFPCLDAAVLHRRTQGCGGWIFHSSDVSILFPFGMTSTEIFMSRYTRGLSGELV
jgi:hypothetical protein